MFAEIFDGNYKKTPLSKTEWIAYCLISIGNKAFT